MKKHMVLFAFLLIPCLSFAQTVSCNGVKDAVCGNISAGVNDMLKSVFNSEAARKEPRSFLDVNGKYRIPEGKAFEEGMLIYTARQKTRLPAVAGTQNDMFYATEISRGNGIITFTGFLVSDVYTEKNKDKGQVITGLIINSGALKSPKYKVTISGNNTLTVSRAG